MKKIERSINPFLNALVVPYIEVVKSINTNGASKVYDSYEVEQTKSIRLYQSKEAREFIWGNLTMYARDLLLMLMYGVNPNYEYIIITYEKVAKTYQNEKYGIRRYEESMRELHKYAIIDWKDKSKNSYWYNPIFFSSGSRLKMYPKNKKKVGTTTVFGEGLNLTSIKQIKDERASNLDRRTYEHGISSY